MSHAEQEIARYIANARKLEDAHAYSPSDEHDAHEHRRGDVDQPFELPAHVQAAE